MKKSPMKGCALTQLLYLMWSHLEEMREWWTCTLNYRAISAFLQMSQSNLVSITGYFGGVMEYLTQVCTSNVKCDMYCRNTDFFSFIFTHQQVFKLSASFTCRRCTLSFLLERAETVLSCQRCLLKPKVSGITSQFTQVRAWNPTVSAGQLSPVTLKYNLNLSFKLSKLSKIIDPLFHLNSVSVLLRS